LRRAGPRRLALPFRRTGLAGPVLSGQRIRTRLPGPVAAVVETRIGAAERALLANDLAADALRRMHLAHEALVARSLLWRDRQRHRGKAAAGGAAADGEAAR